MSKPLPISISIITLNEEKNLSRCLESVGSFASEIVVIDSGSTDRTREIAEKFGAIFEVHQWQGQIAQVRVALKHCKQPWVLCLDADEAVSPELVESIRKIFANGEPPESGFFINRLNFYLGQWIRHAWNPEWRLRLARRNVAKWIGREPHYVLSVSGTTAKLSGNLLHYSFRDLQDHFYKSIKWARMSAYGSDDEPHSFLWTRILFSPWLAFFKILVIKNGWRDGWRGWVIAGAKWLNVFAKYAFLIERRWSKQNEDRRA